MKTIQLIEKEDIRDWIREVVTELLGPMANAGERPDVIDNKGLCEMLNISVRTAQNYRDKGVLPYFRVFNKVY